MDPGGDKPRNGHGSRSLQLRAVPLPQLLHLVTALHGGLGRRRGGAATSDRIRHLLPVSRLQIPAPERVPFLAIRVDQRDGLVVRPARRGQATRGGGGLGLGLGLGLDRSLGRGLGLGLDLGRGRGGQRERERERHGGGWAGGDRRWGGGGGIDGRRGRSSSSHEVCLVIVGEG